MRNVRDLDDAPRFQSIRDKAIETPIQHAMTDSFGFGGTNASLIFRAPAG
jgi:3-oxoacyl-(acyl-carrier-protein) synthase